MLSDIEIAQKAKMKPAKDIAGLLGISEEDLELYGDYKAKLKPELWEKIKNNPDGKQIYVKQKMPISQISAFIEERMMHQPVLKKIQ